jgi:hypothetical protein
MLAFGAAMFLAATRSLTAGNPVGGTRFADREPIRFPGLLPVPSPADSFRDVERTI